ncbi:MAG TPA: hypothetical protein VJT68_02720 [Thermoleophilaceae bacterium]|nr:hypothetical protein [Thermoleophilaceae bacterium]
MLKRTTHIALVATVGVAALSGVAIAAHNPAPVTTPYNPDIDPAEFGGPIDNPYLPLRPGTVFTYRGVGDDGMTHELNIVRVTRHKKRIMGIDATVVLDKVWSGGRPEEKTFDWYAQDDAGNVWYMGEDSYDRENGRWVRNDGSWTAGVGNGKPGVIMLAHPRRGDAYRQEYSPGHAVDQAKVLGQGGAVSTPFREFARTLLTREFSTIDRQYEKKWYARGVGVIQEDAVTKSREHSELVSVVHRR